MTKRLHYFCFSQQVLEKAAIFLRKILKKIAFSKEIIKSALKIAIFLLEIFKKIATGIIVDFETAISNFVTMLKP